MFSDAALEKLTADGKGIYPDVEGTTLLASNNDSAIAGWSGFHSVKGIL